MLRGVRPTRRAARAWQLYAAQQLVAGGSAQEAERYIYRALAFQQTVLAHPILSDLDQMRQPQPLPDGPWQFWTGSIESAIELWTELLHRGPANASLTGWAPHL